MAEIRTEILHKRFDDFVAVAGSTLTVRSGDFFVLLGPSGCGKTTTLRMIAGLEMPTSGRIYLDGEDVTMLRPAKRDIAFVFQLFALYPHMSVRQNLAFPLKSQRLPRREIKTRVAEVARMLRIDHLLDRGVSGLAGGDRQRVALGRAIVRRPKAFLMDEPLGTLDAEFRTLMRDELRTMHDRVGATTVYVTHDQLEAMQMGDKIVVMNHGVIEQFGVPQDIYDKPATMFVAEFIGSPPMNFLPFHGAIHAGGSSVVLNEVSLAVPDMREAREGDLVFGVRPEHVHLSDTAPYRGEVLATEYLGTTQIVTLTTPNGLLKARIAADQPARIGETTGLEFNARTITLFDEQSGRALRSELNEGVLADG